MRDPRTTSRAPRSLWICGQLLRSSPHTHRLNNKRRIQDLRPCSRGPADRQFQLSPPVEIVDADQNVVDPAITPIVLMPDPKLRRTVGPWQLWIVTTDEAGSLPSEVEMGSFYEAEEACDAGGPAAEFSS